MGMLLVLYVVPVVFGIACGYFLTDMVLLVLSVVYLLAVSSMFITAREIEILFAFVFLISGGIAVVSAWITHYFATGHTFVGDFLRAYVLRK